MWWRRVKLQPKELNGGEAFGRSVSISDSGRIVAVGMPNCDGETAEEIDIGCVYVYRKMRNGDWTVAHTLYPPMKAHRASDQPIGLRGEHINIKSRGYAREGCFGCSLSVSDKIVVVGAHNINAGSGNAFLYHIDTKDGTPRPSGELLNHSSEPIQLANVATPGDHVGVSVSVSDNVIAVGARKCGAVRSGCLRLYRSNTGEGKAKAIVGKEVRFPRDGRVSAVADSQVSVAARNGSTVLVRSGYERMKPPAVMTTTTTTTMIEKLSLDTTPERVVWQPCFPFKYRSTLRSTQTPTNGRKELEADPLELFVLTAFVLLALIIGPYCIAHKK